MGVADALPIFLFGTLRDPELLGIVVDGQITVQPGFLPDHRVAQAKDQSFPLLVSESGKTAEGVLVSGLSAEQIARLDYYEAPYEYRREATQITVADQLTDAQVYRPDAQIWTPDQDWSLAAWQTQFGPLMREAAVEIMEGFGEVAPSDIAARMPVIRARAQQRLNAAASTTPVRLRKPHTLKDAVLHAKRRSYSHYFALDDMHLTFRQFDGSMSAPVERAVFVSGDAVTVLPYDPVRDTVLLIEQFRAAPFLRGDPNPWSLEAVAGRQDPGETLEETARREALEETGLTLGALHKLSSYYVSPGAHTEYLTSYVGIADLPDSVAGVSGLAEEAEDIRSMVVPFARLMEAVNDGEAENAPLVVSALWLAANRARFQG